MAPRRQEQPDEPAQPAPPLGGGLGGGRMKADDKLPRFCREARSQLPALVSGELAGWPLHVVRAHLRRCAECSAELERQKQLAGALTALRETHVEPPVGLLDD